MEATLVIEHRFRQDANGKIYSSSNSVNTLLWERYLAEFDHLTVLARIKKVNEKISNQYLVSHDKVTFQSIPYYVGPIGFIKKYFDIKKTIKRNLNFEQAYVFRLPSIIGNMVISNLRRKNIPYVVELVGDPWEVFAPGALKTPFSFIHRYRSSMILKKNVRHAAGVIYVTEKTLQKRYPINKNAKSTHASNVILNNNNIAKTAKYLTDIPEKLKLISIGSLEQLYKSPDMVLESIKSLRNIGVNLELLWLGDGIYKDKMLWLARELDLLDIVNFKGNVTSEEVSRELENSHLYIHVSRTEGLPRALIEAMAKGLPCIGSRVGGIPELLDEVSLINKNSSQELVNKIKFFIGNINIMNEQADKNLKKAKEFESSTLEIRRNQVYQSLKRKMK